MSTLKVGTIQNASGVEVYTCKAWVNFDGGSNPPVIRGSGNVSSITDLATGEYRVNFTTAMPDANYSVACAATDEGNWGGVVRLSYQQLPLTGSVTVLVSTGTSPTAQDSRFVSVAIFR